MNESDLKLYRKRAPQWRERYLQKRNEAFATHLNDPEKVPSERFWEVLEEMKAEAKILRSLGHHARSNMVFSMVQMLGYGMIAREDITGFSEELQTRLEPYGRSDSGTSSS